MSLVCLQKGNFKQIKNLLKIVNTDEKIFIYSKLLEEFQYNFQKKCVF